MKIGVRGEGDDDEIPCPQHGTGNLEGITHIPSRIGTGYALFVPRLECEESSHIFGHRENHEPGVDFLENC